MRRYPPFLISIEKALDRSDHPRAAAAQRWLAARRLNSVIDSLLTSIYFQANTGSYTVTLQRREGETDEQHENRRRAAQADHALAALATIELFVVNELRQRGLLHLVGASQPESEDEEVGGLTRIAWSCPVCGGPGDPMPGGRWGCSDGHPAVWDDGHGAQVQILPMEPS